MPRWLILVAACLIFIGLPLPVLAAQRNVSDVVLVDSGAVMPEDLYAAGNRVVIHGRVDGDLMAAAFEDVTITGTVTGDVIALASTTHITGSVAGSVRVVGGSVTIDGEVGGDVVLVSWGQALAGDISGDLITWARHASLGGSVGGDVEGQIGRFTLGGRVDGNLDVTVGQLTVDEGATVGGDLGYRSERPSSDVDASGVEGAVVHRTPLAPNVRVRAMILLAKVVMSLSAGIAGLVVMWSAPGPSARAVARVRQSFGRAWLRGAGLGVVPLVVMAATAGLVAVVPLEVALPVLVAMIPVVGALLGLMGAFALVAPAAVYPWLGDPRGKGRSPVRAFLLGLAAATLAFLVPWLGWLAAATLVPAGIGGWLGSDATVDPPVGQVAS